MRAWAGDTNVFGTRFEHRHQLLRHVSIELPSRHKDDTDLDGQVEIWAGDGADLRSRATVQEFSALIRASSVLLIFWVLTCVAAAAIYDGLTPPEYVSTVQVVLEPRTIAQDMPGVARAFRQLALVSEQSRTEQLIIRSSSVLRYVFDTLGLSEAKELTAKDDSYLTSMLRWGHALNGSAIQLSNRERQMNRFSKRLLVRYVALSYVIEISYRAESPRQAARVANAVASAFARERLVAAPTDGSSSSPYHLAHADALQSQIDLVEQAVKSGTVPVADLPDANLRFLGPALPPLRSAFPRLLPLLALASTFGIVTGFLGIAVRQNADGKIRSKRRLLDQTGIDCVLSVPWSRDRRVAWGQAKGTTNRLRPSFQRIWASLASRIDGERRLAIGFVSWAEGAGTTVLAAGLADLMADARTPATLVDIAPDHRVLGASPPSLRDVVDRDAAAPWRLAHPIVVAALPPLNRPLAAQILLPHFDAVFLVVDARRTTLAELRAAVKILGEFESSFWGVILNKAAVGDR